MRYLYTGLLFLTMGAHAVYKGDTLTTYFLEQDHYLGLSYGLALCFLAYSLLKFRDDRRQAAAGTIGGATLTGALYFGGCYALGCCGSPLLGVYLSLLGASFLGLTKPLVFAVTAASVGLGYRWMEKRTGGCHV